MASTSTVPVEILKELEPILRNLLDHSVLFPALEGRPILSPILPELTSPSDINKLLEYVCNQGQQAIAALVAALNVTKGDCPAHEEALGFISEAIAKRTVDKESALLQILDDIIPDLQSKIDVYPLLPRLMQQKLITNDDFRDLRGPYITREDRVQKLLDIINNVGIDGLVELMVILRDHGDSQHYKAFELLSSKIQEVSDGSDTGIDSSVLQKLEKTGITVTGSSSQLTTAKKKVIIVLSISKYVQLTKENKIETLLLSNSDSRQNSLLEILKENGYHILDFGSMLLSNVNFSDSSNDKLSDIVDCFKELIDMACDSQTVVLVYLSGLSYMYKDSTCLLLENSLDISLNKNDCITDEIIQCCMDSLPTQLVTVIVDCKWRSDSNLNLPWRHLSRWSTQTVVIANTEQEFGQLTEVFTNGISSWFQRGSPSISHYQFYQSLIYFCKKAFPDSKGCFNISGDVDRALFGVTNIPISLHVCGVVVGTSIETCVGKKIFNVSSNDVIVTSPWKPEVKYKGTITSITGTTSVVELNDSVTDIENGELVFVFLNLLESDKIEVKLDIEEQINENYILSYLSQSSCLKLSKSSYWSIKVRGVQRGFEILSYNGSLKLYIESLEHTKSLIERYGHYATLQKLKGLSTGTSKLHSCYLYHSHSRPLLLKETTVNSSPYFDGYPPKNALSNYEDGTYWVPQGQHGYGWFQVILKGSHIITSLEVRVPPDVPNYQHLVTHVTCISKVDLVKSRFEGPRISEPTVEFPLCSYDKYRQLQYHTVASAMKITALKFDLNESPAAFMFKLVPTSSTKEIEKYTIIECSQSVQFTPPLNTDNSISLKQNGDNILTIHFTNQLDYATLKFNQTEIDKIQIIYPTSGKPVEIFELELSSDNNVQTIQIPQKSLITKHSFDVPVIASEIFFNVPPGFPYQFQVYGSNGYKGRIIETEVGQILKFLFVNSDSAKRPIYLTVLCLEETGAIQNIICQEKVAHTDKCTKFIRTTLPQNYKTVKDEYKVFVSCSPLRLDHLQQPGLPNYFNIHQYTLPLLNNQVSFDGDGDYYCYEFTVQTTKANIKLQ